MSNITQQIAYPTEADPWGEVATLPEIKRMKARSRVLGQKVSKPVNVTKPQKLTSEDMEIVAALEAVRSDMEFLHNCFDQTTDAILVDSLIYELKAANLKYQYYLNICKEKGIVCGTMPRG